MSEEQRVALVTGGGERIFAQIPVGRLGFPEEIAGTVGYLVSDPAAFATGSDLSINDGQHMY